MPPLIWAVLIIVIFTLQFGSFPDQAILGGITPAHIAHFLVFLVFSFLLAVALKKQYGVKLLRKHGIKIALFLGWVYGTLMEFIQLYLVEVRSYQELDILLNMAGALFGILLFYLIYKGTVSMG